MATRAGNHALDLAVLCLLMLIGIVRSLHLVLFLV